MFLPLYIGMYFIPRQENHRGALLNNKVVVGRRVDLIQTGSSYCEKELQPWAHVKEPTMAPYSSIHGM